jgi:hypothetical protein
MNAKRFVTNLLLAWCIHFRTPSDLKGSIILSILSHPQINLVNLVFQPLHAEGCPVGGLSTIQTCLIWLRLKQSKWWKSTWLLVGLPMWKSILPADDMCYAVLCTYTNIMDSTEALAALVPEHLVTPKTHGLSQFACLLSIYYAFYDLPSMIYHL